MGSKEAVHSAPREVVRVLGGRASVLMTLSLVVSVLEGLVKAVLQTVMTLPELP